MASIVSNLSSLFKPNPGEQPQPANQDVRHVSFTARQPLSEVKSAPMTAIPPHPNCGPKVTPSDLCFEETRHDLFSMLVLMGTPLELAEDASQEAILRDWQWRKDKKLTEVQNHAAWLRSIAIKHARTMLRRQARYKALEAAELIAQPDDALAREEEANALRQAIANLPENQQVIFVACAVNGMTLQQAGKKFGLPPGTVNGRLIKARQLLREELRSWGFEIWKLTKKTECGARKRPPR
jgi:RNA polymerase sigma-70 factor, ECF subfamily